MGGTVEVPRGQWKNYYTIRQVGKLIGREPQTIKTWLRSGAVSGATHYGVRGDGTTAQYVWLYTKRDVSRLRRYAETSKERQGNRESSR